MKEKLEKLIADAKQEWLRHCLVTEEPIKLSEAAFIAEALIRGGVCLRLEIPREAVARRCATCRYETALGSDRCVQCHGHELWEEKTDGKRN